MNQPETGNIFPTPSFSKRDCPDFFRVGDYSFSSYYEIVTSQPTFKAKTFLAKTEDAAGLQFDSWPGLQFGSWAGLGFWSLRNHRKKIAENKKQIGSAIHINQSRQIIEDQQKEMKNVYKPLLILNKTPNRKWA